MQGSPFSIFFLAPSEREAVGADAKLTVLAVGVTQLLEWIPQLL